ncbi:MAG: flagellar basal body rod protein FlgB [Bdellovibrionales bacterium]
MSMMDGGIMTLMKDKLSYLSQRQAVLAQNVANANTPGYKAKDLAPFTSFAQEMQAASTGMKVSNDKHITPASMSGVNVASKKMRSFEVSPTGNSVDLEQQMMEVSATTVEFQADTSILHKFMSMIKQAIGKSS